MEKGTIGKILDYYFSNPRYSKEIESAMIEFFDVESMQALRRNTIEERMMELFSEWFVFDYKWNDKEATLFKFFNDNPLHLNQTNLRVFKDLQNNQYGTWEVVSVNPGQGLRLENLQTGEKFNIKEFSATFQLHPKEIFYSRIAFIQDHWEMVGANTFIWGVKLHKSVKDIWRKDESKISPKDARRMLEDNPNNDGNALGKNLPTFKEAEEKLTRTLKRFKINTYVTLVLIKKWIYNLKKDMISHFEIIDRLTGLVNFDELDDLVDINELIHAYNDFYNLSPQKCLKNKSPSQLVAEDPSYILDFVASITPIGHGEELEKIQKQAHEAMGSGDYSQALKYFNKYFRELLKRRTTIFFIYRVYANKATCHFACGHKVEGKRMIDIALELNPNYDFGQKLLRQYEAGEFIDIRDVLGLRIRRGYFKKDASEIYYDFLKKLNINFTTDTLTTSNIKIYGPNNQELKTGRNDICPCGAKHPDGRPKKFKKCHGL